MIADIFANAICFAADAIRGKPASWRSRDWRRIRAHHLKAEPACAWCKGTKRLAVHHIRPVHESPATELDPLNLLTLCHKCHFVHGHVGSWEKSNPNIRADCLAHRKAWKGQL